MPTKSNPRAKPDRVPPDVPSAEMPDRDDHVLTAREAARILRVNQKSLYALIAAGELAGVRRIGRCLRISRQAVMDWLARGTGSTERAGRPR
jgi:excisionase family DNA binding protein